MSEFSFLRPGSVDWMTFQRIEDNLARVKKQLRTAGMDSAADLRSVLTSIDQLEVDIGRTLLKLHALSEVLLRKGLVSEEELTAAAKDIDATDGEADGQLHPSLFRTEEENSRVPSPRAFLVALEKQDVLSPEQFFAKLEREGRPEANK